MRILDTCGANQCQVKSKATVRNLEYNRLTSASSSINLTLPFLASSSSLLSLLGLPPGVNSPDDLPTVSEIAVTPSESRLPFLPWECKHDQLPFPDWTDSLLTCVWVGLAAVILVVADIAWWSVWSPIPLWSGSVPSRLEWPSPKLAQLAFLLCLSRLPHHWYSEGLRKSNCLLVCYCGAPPMW